MELIEKLNWRFATKSMNGQKVPQEKVDKVLNLKEKGPKSVLLLPLGYRDASNDWLVNLTKVRKSKEDFITEVN